MVGKSCARPSIACLRAWCVERDGTIKPSFSRRDAARPSMREIRQRSLSRCGSPHFSDCLSSAQQCGSAPGSFKLNRLINDRETTSAFSIQRKRLSVFQSVRCRRERGAFQFIDFPQRPPSVVGGSALLFPFLVGGRPPCAPPLFYDHATGCVVKFGFKFKRHHASAKEMLRNSPSLKSNT